jgi:hypothetical protein
MQMQSHTSSGSQDQSWHVVLENNSRIQQMHALMSTAQ